ncbi:neuronal acetylcholine receptor subunit alpha-10-like isoform X2 [Nematostella vectensis]|uniref:neuronal acetylcholine receptor subunit alpha-10-like isoform X2 n=1 Tax=Nematostella vectensis TaxID=45351 RepID=UPI0020778A3A|nr:neuronal acetylcholine receptor subunit alpha-10-like isoform X2 [Nematostella vectensis]
MTAVTEFGYLQYSLLSLQEKPLQCSSVRVDNHEQRLVDHLFKGYDPTVRPVYKKSDTVLVRLGITLHQLIDVEFKNQVVKSSIFIRQAWLNPFLKWNASAFGGITTINVDPKRIWKPDIYLYNKLVNGFLKTHWKVWTVNKLFGDRRMGTMNTVDDQTGAMNQFDTHVTLSFTGQSMWLAPKILKSSCKFDVTHFPFDEQKCDLKFGSWTYDGFHLDIASEHPAKCEGDYKKFIKGGEWDLIGLPCRRNELVYICCPEPYPDLTYTIILRRKSMFYFVNMIAPCFLITALTLLSFYLPSESGERLTLVITNLLALTVFMLLVAEMIPPTSETVPLVLIYFYGSFFEVALALVATCVVLRCYFNDPSHTPIPAWIRIFVLGCLAKILRIHVPKFKVNKKPVENNENSEVPKLDETSTVTFRGFPNRRRAGSRPVSIIETDAQSHLGKSLENGSVRRSMLLSPTDAQKRHSSINPRFSIYGIDGVVPNIPQASNLEKRQSFIQSSRYDLRLNESRDHTCDHPREDHVGRAMLNAQTRIADGVSELVQYRHELEMEEEMRNEWKLIAKIVDKFFLWVFLMLVSITTVIIFLQAPMYKEAFKEKE